jgi:hypothetical protein
MASTRTRRPSSRRRTATLVRKPRGVLHPRVQQVGPEHFGIVCFDCHKPSSKFLLADFYDRLLRQALGEPDSLAPASALPHGQATSRSRSDNPG